MRIIREGILVKNHMLVTCRECYAELDIGSKDLDLDEAHENLDLAIFSFQCAYCKRKNLIFGRSLSKGIRSELNTK